MATIEAAIKDAILRGVRHEIRVVATPLRRDVHRLRQALRQLRQDLSALKLVADGWQRAVENAPLIPQVTEEEAKAARLSPRLIRALRGRLGLSQAKLARVAGVSTTAVEWRERGRSSPSGKNRAAIVALRKLGAAGREGDLGENGEARYAKEGSIRSPRSGANSGGASTRTSVPWAETVGHRPSRRMELVQLLCLSLHHGLAGAIWA